MEPDAGGRDGPLEEDDALRQRDAFILALAHDLRASVSAAAGGLEVLRARLADLTAAEIATVLDNVVCAVGGAERVLANLFDAERFRHGAAEPVRSPTSLVELVDRVLAATGSAGRVTADVTDEVVEVDPGLTERIISNLVHNALVHTPQGTPVEIHIGVRGGEVLVRVDDHGHGIPLEVRPDVFRPFHRSTGQGAGVGLYLVREFARLHGGDAEIEDVPGGGASVCVRLQTA